MARGFRNPAQMSVETTPGDPAVVRASGEIDLSNWEGLKSALAGAASDSPRGLIVDLTDVDYIDSAGLQAVLMAYHTICRQRQGLLVLVLGNANMRMIFGFIQPEQLPGCRVTEDLASARAMFE